MNMNKSKVSFHTASVKFIYLSNDKYILSTSSVPASLLGFGVKQWTRELKPFFHGDFIFIGKIDLKQANR